MKIMVIEFRFIRLLSCLLLLIVSYPPKSFINLQAKASHNYQKPWNYRDSQNKLEPKALVIYFKAWDALFTKYLLLKKPTHGVDTNTWWTFLKMWVQMKTTLFWIISPRIPRKWTHSLHSNTWWSFSPDVRTSTKTTSLSHLSPLI